MFIVVVTDTETCAKARVEVYTSKSEAYERAETLVELESSNSLETTVDSESTGHGEVWEVNRGKGELMWVEVRTL
jgi:hypothetical protein